MDGQDAAAEDFEALLGLDSADIQEQLHSFEHWFQSVEGYLPETTFGHRSDIGPVTLSEAERSNLVTTLCSYAIAELTALEVSSSLIRMAPNRSTKVFLATQVVDEGRHVEVVHQRLRELDVADVDDVVQQRANPCIHELRNRLLSLVHTGDWLAAVFAQNVILESMEFTTFEAHARSADAITADMLGRMIRDERRHMGFGETQLGQALQTDPGLASKLKRLKADLDPIVLRTFEDSLERLGVPPERRHLLGQDYLAAVARLGVG